MRSTHRRMRLLSWLLLQFFFILHSFRAEIEVGEVVEKMATSTLPEHATETQKRPESAALNWTVHPLVEEPWSKTALLCGIIVGLAYLTSSSFDGLGYGLATLIVLTFSLSRYFLPTRYTLDANGVQVRHLGWSQPHPWKRFCRAELCPNGVFLSPFARPRRLEAFRGCFLRCLHQRQAVMEAAQAHIEHVQMDA